MKKENNYTSLPLKGLSTGNHPVDEMRTLAHKMLPMNGKDSGTVAKNSYIKSSFRQPQHSQIPPGKAKFMSKKPKGF